MGKTSIMLQSGKQQLGKQYNRVHLHMNLICRKKIHTSFPLQSVKIPESACKMLSKYSSSQPLPPPQSKGPREIKQDPNLLLSKLLQ